MSEPDYSNQFFVSASAQPDMIQVIRPPKPGEVLTVDEALNLAAWLVAIADPAGDRFTRMLTLVRGD